MKALRFHQFGGPDVYRFEEVPIPEPDAGELLIRVDGAGVNPVDWKIREGLFKPGPPSFPMTAMFDFSGRIEKIGEGVEGFAIGDAVYGVSYSGTCAEYCVAPAQTTGYRPASMDPADAAAIPTAAITAWQALFDHGGLKAGQKVLIHAGSGGVGSFAIQFAKWKGATVYSTASTQNQDLLHKLGADVAIDYTKQRFEEVAAEMDLVFETVSPNQMNRSLACVKPGGILVSIVGPALTDETRGTRGVLFSAKATREQLEAIAGLIEDNIVRPVIETVVPFGEAVEAEKEVQSGHTRGKVVVRVRQ